ncbi:8-oxo-dGTP diphosphatase [Jatrophihabitans sp. GAS493]|uniref:NUDIX hydrolase n=1 Tax=Jatrophihabitans sp. GAS493 TaxID=1907575 RepID=UPI000BB8EAB8|nr:NUDIX domain-containing protein [Jatrophihabitans sp. GAS493]SOD73406.1 8-oxo-dGTP diphosphatase [Jatrophihabitans sp. GAS493]
MSSLSNTGLVRAAGGVVWRRDGGGRSARHAASELEIAVIHRQRYDDWSLPKGKIEAGESPLDAAVREVREEIGAQVAVDRHLQQVHYALPRGPKEVDYWGMRYLEGDFSPSAEVDRLVWLSPEEAKARLTYELDRQVLETFTRHPLTDSVVVLIRHAKAGKRSAWTGRDELRPLEQAGRAQALRLAAFGSYFAPERILSADRTRCEQTVAPLAKATGLPVELGEEFTDEGYFDTPRQSLKALLELGSSGGATVICSQGGAIPGLLADLELVNEPDSLATRKGAAWVLCFTDGQIASVEYYPKAAS